MCHGEVRVQFYGFFKSVYSRLIVFQLYPRHSESKPVGRTLAILGLLGVEVGEGEKGIIIVV